MRRILTAVAILFVCTSLANAQPIARPYPFDIEPLDTVSSEIFDAIVPAARELGNNDRLKLGQDGHLLNFKNERVRLFGTSLMYNAQFLPQEDAKKLAVRLRKLGFNAVKFVQNDYFGWDDASFFKTYNDAWTEVLPSSYTVNPLQLARFDTLLYELKRNAIYAVIVLNSGHRYSYNEGVAGWDSTYWNGTNHHFWDPGAQRLQREWARTLMNHVNPLTGIALKDDPMIAYVGFNQEQSLYFYWQNHLLNYIDDANKLTSGIGTISYLDSRRLDSAFSRYLQKKYVSQAALMQAWGGDPNPVKKNLVDNGSFENFSSAAWTFTASNGANAGQVEGDGGVDSSVFAKIRINSLGPNPLYNDIVLYNLSPRLGFDTLYEVTFWAKMGYDHAKRPGITQRSLGLLVFSYGTNAVGLNGADVIDTAWKKYSFKFRAAASGLHYLYFYFGTDLGDVWLDAIEIHRAPEIALQAHENLAQFKIDRVRYDQLANYPRARTRDLVKFYDSLETGFYKTMEDHLHGVGYHGLVNYTQTQWYSMLPDMYKAREADIAEAHVGWDYLSGRPGMGSTDSTWMVRNIPMVKSTTSATLYNLAANAIAHKGFVVGDYQVPWMNQYHSEHLVMLPAFAAYQDWDGIFFTPFATFREDLYAKKLPNQYASEGGFSSIAKNPAVLSLLPSASHVFRNGLIAPASVEDTISHIADDVWLFPVHPGYRGYYGVEGYLDPNAATAFRMRQSFDAKTHRVAAEYPYLPDTSVKRFDGGQIVWDQTNGMFNVSTPDVKAGSGFFGLEGAPFGELIISRKDAGKDMLSFYLQYAEIEPGVKVPSFFTLSTRAQNSGHEWATDSLSFAKDFGSAPVIMSGATVDLTFDVRFGLSYEFIPLDSNGKVAGASIRSEFVDGNWTQARVRIDQSKTGTPWYAVVSHQFVGSVDETDDDVQAIAFPNPVIDRLTITAGDPIKRVQIVNMVGQTMLQAAHNTSNVKLDVASLSPGAYTVIIETAKGKKILPLRKL